MKTTIFKISQAESESHLREGTTVNGRPVESLRVNEIVTINVLLGALPITAIETYTVEE